MTRATWSPAVALSAEGGLKEHVKVARIRIERELVRRALDQTGGNVTHAARLLKISLKGLQLKMKVLGLRERTPEKFEPVPAGSFAVLSAEVHAAA